jgi:hypothetical protein
VRAASIIVFLALGVFFTTPEQSNGQGETAVPFLLIPASPEGNGMGGIVGSTISENPMATVANPGQLGMISLDHYFIGGFYPSSTTWFPGSQVSDLRYTTTAFNAGLNLSSLTSLPFELSIGFGYSHVGFDLGTFVATNGTGGQLSSFNAEDNSNNWSVGIGIDYFIKMGIGYTNKNVASNLAPFNVQGQGRQGVASVTTYDIGLIAQVPVAKILDQLSGNPITFFGSAEPVFDISFGYARRNLGNAFVTYIDAANSDPLPRNAMVGLSYKVGFTLPRTTAWEIFSFTLARESEDILVQRFPPPRDSSGTVIGNPPRPEYIDGNGAIQFINNVVLGEGNGRVTLRKGWQVNFGELFLLRGGSVNGRGVSYITSGYGLRLGGVLKAFKEFIPSFSNSPVTNFILSHIDIRYDHASSEYDDRNNPNDGVTYNGLSLLVK